MGDVLETAPPDPFRTKVAGGVKVFGVHPVPGVARPSGPPVRRRPDGAVPPHLLGHNNPGMVVLVLKASGEGGYESLLPTPGTPQVGVRVGRRPAVGVGRPPRRGRVDESLVRHARAVEAVGRPSTDPATRPTARPVEVTTPDPRRPRAVADVAGLADKTHNTLVALPLDSPSS